VFLLYRKNERNREGREEQMVPSRIATTCVVEVAEVE
jgi:hypothetical protein